eukprot:m.55098 g.55098  ORF g.55098 m.55098 type:complete len:299 (+) comp7740_c0_seq1:99-995(+)
MLPHPSIVFVGVVSVLVVFLFSSLFDHVVGRIVRFGDDGKPYGFGQSLCDIDAEYHIVFEEEFDGWFLDRRRWTPTLGWATTLGRDALLTPENIYLEKGDLVLRSQRDLKYNFTSGAVTTMNKVVWQYGRTCVVAMLPGTNGTGAGIWPAHWMMPNDNTCHPDRGEIDILEMLNADGITYSTLHYNYEMNICTMENRSKFNTSLIPDFNTVYHEYAVEWEADHLTFFINSQPLIRLENTYNSSVDVGAVIPQAPHYLLLNTAIGGNWPGPVNENTAFPIYHKIDSVRVSQKQWQCVGC